MTAIPDLEALGALLRETAATEIMPRFGRVVASGKADGSVVTAADLAAQDRVRAALAAAYPDIPLLAEEMPAAEQEAVLRQSRRGAWCLDPLDGTSNFAAGFPFFAMSLAWIDVGRVELGLVFDPVRFELFTARRGGGAWLNGRRLRLDREAATLAAAIALVDFKRLPVALGTRLATAPPFRSQRNLGSTALDWCWLAAGRADVYAHGGQRLWDYAGGALVFAEAGGTPCLLDRWDGECRDDLTLRKRIAVGAVHPALQAEWLAWLRAAVQPGNPG
jgi:myo-inositol-1(or 4)-monophosphatase